MGIRPLEVLRLFLPPGDGNVSAGAGMSSFTGDAWESEDELSDNWDWATNSSSEESTAEDSEAQRVLGGVYGIKTYPLVWTQRGELPPPSVHRDL